MPRNDRPPLDTFLIFNEISRNLKGVVSTLISRLKTKDPRQMIHSV